MTWTTRPRSEFGKLAAIKEGTGPTLLLLHGVGLRAEAWNGQIDGLRDKFSIVAPDMPGHGLSQPFEDAARLSEYTDRVAEMVDGPVLIAGHSMGAMIALELACRFPEYVQGVAALNAIYQRDEDATRAIQTRAKSMPIDHAADPAQTLTRWFGSSELPARDFCSAWLKTVSPAAYKLAYSAFAQEGGPKERDLAALQMPALFITGADEPNSTPAMSRAMAATVPDGEAVIVEGAAHMMPMTHPQRINAELTAFFDRCLT